MLRIFLALWLMVWPVFVPAQANLLLTGAGGGGTPAACTPGTGATNFLARTSGLSGTETTAYCNLINGLVSDGIITGTMNGANSGSGACGALLDGLWVLVTNSTTTAALNLCGTSYSLTLNGTCTLTADAGYPCDGTTGFFNTGFIPSTATTPNFTLNSGFICAFIISSRTTVASKVPVGTANSASANAYMDPYNTGPVLSYALNVAFGSAGSLASSNAKGAYLVNRSSSSLTSVYVNGSSTAATTSAAASVNNPTKAFYVSALDNNGTTASFSNDTIGAVAIGGGSTPLTNIQAAAIENRINTFLAVFGKNAY